MSRDKNRDMEISGDWEGHNNWMQKIAESWGCPVKTPLNPVITKDKGLTEIIFFGNPSRRK